MTASSRQADSIAVIALGLPEQPVTRDVLLALTKAYRAGWEHALTQSSVDLARALAYTNRRQAG